MKKKKLSATYKNHVSLASPTVTIYMMPQEKKHSSNNNNKHFNSIALNNKIPFYFICEFNTSLRHTHTEHIIFRILHAFILYPYATNNVFFICHARKPVFFRNDVSNVTRISFNLKFTNEDGKKVAERSKEVFHGHYRIIEC